ncbi:uncharacterized protein LOC131515131 isoform X2 [Neofelis nebulosa]|uniref:uncharacterized protein LOC131515131 isoform X2 n=1 Tax=Neofelis nebulosa TaxID=61452 RepID=UPI002729FA7A|nr:uncharacterized protein LOC131515131 isoform X2 [Neofelis nebulosa]
MSAAPRNCHWTLAAAGAPRLRPEASPPEKKFARQCSSSVSGIVGNHNTHLTPGFTLKDLVWAPANVAAFWGLLGPGGFNSLHQMSFQQWDRFSPCGPRTSRTPLCSWGFALPTRAPPVFCPAPFLTWESASTWPLSVGRLPSQIIGSPVSNEENAENSTLKKRDGLLPKI